MFVFCLERGVKPKKILRFYFGADSLERAFDNLITSKAFDTEGDALENAEKICLIIDEKMRLERLWTYLDGIISILSGEEKSVLMHYSARRVPAIGEAERRAVRRAVIKFTRRARRLNDFEEAFNILKKYYCLISV